MSGMDDSDNAALDGLLAKVADARRSALATLRSIGIDPTRYDDIARREWPHMPIPLARSYAEEYVRTGKRP